MSDMNDYKRKAEYGIETKDLIKDAIEAKGVTVGEAVFRDYPDKIAEIGGVCADATAEVYLNGIFQFSQDIPAGDTEAILVSTPNHVLKAYTANDTYTKPAGLRYAVAVAVGGGGGGGAGHRGAASTNRTGGGGGEAGVIVTRLLHADEIGATEAIAIGTGGKGANTQTVDSTNGAAGMNGSDTTFGALLKAAGGLGGVGGIAGTLTANSAGRNAADIIPNQDYFVYSDLSNYRGTRGTNSTGEGSSVQMFKQAARFGGGGGAGLNTSNAQAVGGAGSRIFDADDNQSAVVAGGTAGGGVGGDGCNNCGNQILMFFTDKVLPTLCVGTSGAGGGSSNSAASGKGGNGGVHGGAGGGGGASVNGQLSGAGGDGAQGLFLILEIF
jgi:hypothetical protein